MSQPALAHDRFVELFAQQQSQVYAYIRTLLPNASEAEEVFQQTVLVLWRKWGQFDPDGNFVHWACGIAHNEVRNYLRLHARRNQYLTDQVIEAIAHTVHDSQDWLEARRAALARCRDRLPSRDRLLINRCYADDVSIRDLAPELGMTANVLYKSLRKIRRRLYECVTRSLAQEGA